MAQTKRPKSRATAKKKVVKKSISKPEAHRQQHKGLLSKINGFFKIVWHGLLHVFWHNKFGRILTYLFLAWLISALSIITWYQVRHWNDKSELGVSYSIKYANELGIDWQEGFTAMLDEVGFRRFRLMSYWDMLEQEDDQFTFEQLDWLFDEAEKRGARIDLSIGERQPRWPECHYPEWIKDSLGTPEFDEELLEFIEVVVNRYKTHPALEQYQLENEIFNNLFGECYGATRERVQAEYDLVKRLDPDRPVVINVSNQSGTPLRQPVGDKVGFSVYFVAWGDWTGFGFYFKFWHVPPIWHSYRAGLIELIHGTDTETFVHELQTEPWGPVATVDLSREEQAKSMTIDELQKRVRFAEQIGMSEIYLWGGEWWHWLETEYGDTSYKEEVKRLIDDRPYQF